LFSLAVLTGIEEPYVLEITGGYPRSRGKSKHKYKEKKKIQTERERERANRSGEQNKPFNLKKS
jgi:hypothetical protein